VRRLTPSQNYSGNENFRRQLQQVYETDRNAYQETELLNDHYFGNLVLQMKTRLTHKLAPQVTKKCKRFYLPSMIGSLCSSKSLVKVLTTWKNYCEGSSNISLSGSHSIFMMLSTTRKLLSIHLNILDL
jgi:hypothetical protein